MVEYDEKDDDIDWIEDIPEEYLDGIMKDLVDNVGDKISCELCGHSEWGVDTKFVSIFPVRTTETLSHVTADLSMISPCLWLSCKNCGNSKIMQAKAFPSLKGKFGGADER